MAESAVWFEGDEDEDLPAAQAEFVVTLRQLAPALAPFGIGPDHTWLQYCPDGPLCAAIDFSSRLEGQILRSLRIDFYESHALVGDDETFQFVTALDPSSSGVSRVEGVDATVVAKLCFAWLLAEASRPIDRHRWKRRPFTHTRHVMRDSQTCIGWSDTGGERREDLGPPDEIEEAFGPQSPSPE